LRPLHAHTRQEFLEGLARFAAEDGAEVAGAYVDMGRNGGQANVKSR
jgi:hypothetical protein